MTGFLIYPEIDGESNFPPVIRQALADSPEFEAAFAPASGSSVYRKASGSFIAGPPLGSGLDDTPVLQALCDQARAAGYSEVVLRQNSVYLINGLRPNGGSTDQKSIRLRGEGSLGYNLGTSTIQASTILRRLPSSTGPGIIAEGHAFELENLDIDGNGVTGQGFTIDVPRGFELRWRNVRIHNSPSGAVRALALSNPYFENVHIQTSGTDGLLTSTVGAAPAMLIAGNATAYEAISNTVNINGLHLERNNGCDLQFGPDDASGSYAEFVNIVGLHIESVIDNTAYGSFKSDPALWIGNSRGVNLIHPYIYGGKGTLLYVNRKRNAGNTAMTGLNVFGGTLMGYQVSSGSDHIADATNTPSNLIDLVAGDYFNLYGTTLDCALTELIHIRSTFGANVSINDPKPVTRTGSTSTVITDDRTGWVSPQRNKAIGGTGWSTPGGSVDTRNSSGAVRNVLDDGTGAASISGILTLLAGVRWINRTVTTTQALTLADMGVVSTATSIITLTLPASSNSMFYIKNLGTKHLLVAAPVSGSAPSIDGAASISLMPGEGLWLNGRSSSVGTWSVVSHSAEQFGSGIPTLTPGANLGTGAPTPTLDSGSNDNRGRIQFGTGTTPAAGSLIAVTFAAPFPVPPFVTVSQASQSGAGVLFAKDVTTTGFNLGCTSTPAASQSVGTYAANYRVSA